MKPLGKTLRNQLERSIKEAREVAESAVRAALEKIGPEIGPGLERGPMMACLPQSYVNVLDHGVFDQRKI